MGTKSSLKAAIAIGIIILLGTLFLGSAQAEGQWGSVKVIRVLGGPSGSGSYTLYCNIANHFDKIDEIRGSCLAGSSKPNIKAINEGKAEFGYSFDVDCNDALNRKGYFKDYKKKVENVSFIANQFARGIAFFVRADSPIKSIDDLKSKHIALGPKGYGANSLALAVLDSYGITDKSIGKHGGRISKMTVGDSCAGLQDKTVDCQALTVSLTSRYPKHTALEELFGLRLLPIEGEHLEKIRKKYPQYPKVIFPGGIYKNAKEDYPTIGMTVNFLCASRLPDNLVYKTLEILYSRDCRKSLYDISKGFLPVILENGLLGSGGLPVHPGALKFYKDKGITRAPDVQITPKSAEEALNKYKGQWSEKGLEWVKI